MQKKTEKICRENFFCIPCARFTVIKEFYRPTKNLKKFVCLLRRSYSNVILN